MVRLSGTNRMWPIAVLAVLMGCAVGEVPPGGPAGPAGEAAPAGPTPAPVDPGEPGRPGVSEAAAELLARARLAYEAAEVEEALELALRVVDEHRGTSAAVDARWVGARAAFALSRWAESLELAESFISAGGAGPSADEARRLAELARDELEPVATAPVRLGVVLPRTGSRIMVRYGELLLEGIELAVRQAEAREGRSIEIVVVDDAGGTRTREAVAELEAAGVTAVVGPLLPQAMAEAAGARRDQATVVVSPTVPEQPAWPNVYTINSGDARGAQELGRYAAELGFTQAAVLHGRSPEAQRKASAFAVEFEAMGGVVRATVPYDSGTTTFAPHLERIVEAVAPAWPAVDSAGVPLGDMASADSAYVWAGRSQRESFALFVAAPERDVRQIAPQVAFYGLDSVGVQVFGDESWTSAAVRRVVPRQDLEGVIAASRFPPGRGDALADPAFVRAFEERYRRSLDNQLPALGFDAASLVLHALPNRTVTPAALARRFELLAGVRGATGTFSVRADRIVRTPFLVMIRDGGLAPAPVPGQYVLPSAAPASHDPAGEVRQ